MKVSRRVKRMQRHHRRMGRRYAFNLVSLMDIFTILVFFLLVNSADVQTLPNPKDLHLPESSAEKQAEEAVVVMLTREDILVQGERVMSIEQALNSEEQTLPAVGDAIKAHAGRRLTALTDEEAEAGRGEVTVMAHKALPYRLIKKVMLTVTGSQFGRISLAVIQEGQQGSNL